MTAATLPDLPPPEAPRVCHYPTYKSSAGQEAIELAASAGLDLDPWQQFVLRHSLGERESDGRWSAFEVGLIVARQQGKGSVLEARELAGLVLFGDKRIMHTAHEVKTAKQHQERLSALFEANADLSRLVKSERLGNNDPGFTMRNGANLHIMARTGGAARGFSGDLVVYDEAYALVNAQVEASTPTILARDNAQIWYTSSPPLSPVTGEVLFRVRGRGEAGDASRLAWFDYGLAGTLDRLDDIDLDDRRNWYAALPALRSGRVREENVQTLRDLLSDEGFAREILGIWPAGLGDTFKVISPDDWSDAEDVTSEIEDLFSLAVAVSVDRSRSAIVAVGKRADGKLHMEVTSTPLRSDNRGGTAWVPARVAAIARRRAPINVVMDSFGPTGSLIVDVERALEDELQGGAPEVIKLGMGDVSRAFGMFYDRVAGPDRDGRTLRHIGQAELTSAVANATTRQLGDGLSWDRRSPSADITPLVAATHALFGWVTRSDEFGTFNIY